jgi:hypothetical protein
LVRIWSPEPNQAVKKVDRVPRPIPCLTPWCQENEHQTQVVSTGWNRQKWRFFPFYPCNLVPKLTDSSYGDYATESLTGFLDRFYRRVFIHSSI